ncbi:hypothetical protein WJX79_006040 [Trebouxia sp. C0005]
MAFVINDLEPQTLVEIFRLLSARDCAKMATCQKLWRNIAADDSLWQVWCDSDFLLKQTVAPTGHPQDTWRDAYATWHLHFGRYKSYTKRAIAAWQTIEHWTKAHHPDIYQSLGDPATERQLDDAERLLKVKLPPSLRVIYRLHNGQDLSCDERFPDLMPYDSMFHGLLGGYSFYDHIVCTRLMPIEKAAQATIRLRNRNGHIDYGDCVQLTGSIMTRKHFMLVDEGSQMRVSTCDDDRSWDAAPPGGNDAMLRWLEAFASVLKDQLGCCHLLERMNSFGICLHPAHEPWQRVAVTKGVKVQAASIFVPELSKLRCSYDAEEAFFFSYNVQFSLLPVEEQQASWPADAGPFSPITSVQLQTRHWIIRDQTGEITQDIHGDGVIGRHPILAPGGTPFVYQSCTHQQQPRGSMGGFFKFVEGTTRQPTGPAFDVVCPEFMLEKPQYVF